MYCMVEIAFDKRNELNEVINILLSRKLACSCQVIEANNTWNWVGYREQSKEYLLHIKTKKDLLDEVYSVVKSIHSYQVFEFAVYELTSPCKEYLDWIEEETCSVIK